MGTARETVIAVESGINTEDGKMRKFIGSLFGAAVTATFLATAPGAQAVPAPASALAPAGVQESISSSFYCGAANVWRRCSLTSSHYPAAWTWELNGVSPSVHLLVDNHAAGGEACRIIVNGGTFDARYIDPTYKLWTWLGNAGRDPEIQLECIRRSQSGDAGIGGRIQFNY
ncbi:hypothetical protein [Streptomyces sp. SID3212]|uniref:hypothetical protein n=1 Tax=Streptomyces sp. SID3212 TaxID=2690259 RepID=UPI00136A9C5F|nr:hypothetical protein [Streptomyces sp. SID3212]MYV56879.1 hypothetical protein [Streptomyces sp. SID3212]